MTEYDDEVGSGKRFEFGKNWHSFLGQLNDDRIKVAEESLKKNLNMSTLKGLRFLDAGNGSGLFSLAARRLGATVRSFDFDPNSVACARELKSRYFPDDDQWEISSGSVLDEEFVLSLGKFDVSYCWGVLHHTGEMWKGMELISRTVKPGGKYFIMIYLDRGWKSKFWWRMKKFYCSGAVQRRIALTGYVGYAATRQFIRDVTQLKNPFAHYGGYTKQRGMSKYHDWVDWIGGFPFEYATPPRVIEFCEKLGFKIAIQDYNEYVFDRVSKE